MPREDVQDTVPVTGAADKHYKPLTPSDWSPPPKNVQEALDQLAENVAGGAGTPSDTVEDETTWGISADAGVAATYSRGDHTHGTPPPPEGTAIKSTGEDEGKVLQAEGDDTCSWVAPTVYETAGAVATHAALTQTHGLVSGAIVGTDAEQTLSNKIFSDAIESTVITGGAPFTIASTTMSNNLNADLLDGNHAAAFATAGHDHAAIYQPLDGTLTELAAQTITEGCLLYGIAADDLAVLAKGATLQALCMNVGATAPEWVAVTGTGSIVRATSATLTTPVISGVTKIATGTENRLNEAQIGIDEICWHIQNPRLNAYYIAKYIDNYITLLECRSMTDVGTVTFNIEKRAYTTPFAAGTELLTADMVADATGETTTDFVGATDVVDGATTGQWLALAISAIATAPTQLVVHLKYKRYGVSV